MLMLIHAIASYVSIMFLGSKDIKSKKGFPDNLIKLFCVPQNPPFVRKF